MHFVIEDIIALLTFVVAVLFYGQSVSLLNGLNRAAATPLLKKEEELQERQKEAEAVNHASTFAQHGKLMRQCTKLEQEIEVMKARRNTWKRKLLVNSLFYFVQIMGYFALCILIKVVAAARGTSADSVRFSEVIMVPHFFTSWISAPSAEQIVVAEEAREMGRAFLAEGDRTPMSIVSAFLGNDVRGINLVVWYVCCMIAVTAVHRAFLK